MTTNGAGQGVDVNVGACRCPGGLPTPHPDGDIVTLVPELSVPMGIAIARTMNGADPTLPAMNAAVTAGYLEPAPAGGIMGWTFLDALGESEPITPEAIARLIPWAQGGLEVAEEADRLYGSALMAPFQRRMERLSPAGPTDDSTSPNPSSGPKSPTRSKRSSRNGRAGKRSAVRAR